MKQEFDVVIQQDADGWYVASVPGLQGCHTQAKSLDVLMKRVREAIAVCVGTEKQRRATPVFIGVQRVRM